MEEFFIALVPITLILSAAGVLIFRPLTKRLGSVMEANAHARQQGVDDKLHHEHVKTLLETQNLKIEQLEQRLEFAESLLEARTSATRRVGPGRAGPSLT
ncbi:MAG: hypothetical protein Q8W45_09200 [Candidatus Palauibacterales bacterium]|jgi:uncharacterized membrane protein|nr:hypothetical protein [Candidatus Palauibacterales bacterium]MDP2483445.1 hypothetical protein [Candidatus Palauibacterales bacterium]